MMTGSRTPGEGNEHAGPGHAEPCSPGPPAVVSIHPDMVRAQLDRLLASVGFRYAERLSRFLKYVVEQQLAGNSGQLKESVLAVEIFDRPASYDSRVDSVVRVEARRLREKLDRYYQDEGREDPVLITLPKGSYAPLFALRPSPVPHRPPEAAPATPARAPVRGPRQVSLRIVVAVLLGAVAATVAVVRWAGFSSPAPAHLTRLTSDSGLTCAPVLSRDGKLLAYSSDRGGNGRLDIWVQQTAGGNAIRLTDNPGDNIEPSFSPDGTLIAYRAEGDDGIYLVPSLGGPRTLLARGGYRPQFSPDGTRIVYWTGQRMFRSAHVYLVPSAGGNPVAVQPDFRYAAYPVWAQDGRHIAFIGSRDPKGRDWESNAGDWDWWVAPVDGGPAVKTSARQAFAAQGLLPPWSAWSHRRILPYCWTSSGHLVFSARTGEHTNIWRIPISSRDWRVSGPARQLTFGTGWQDQPSVAANGALVFSALTHKSDVWSLPVDAASAEPRGPLARLTFEPANYLRPFVSPDGTRLVWVSNRTGNYDVWAQDLTTGRQTALTATRQDEGPPILSPDGSTVAFGSSASLKQAVWTVPFAGGKAVELCPDCGEPRAWLPTGTGILYQRISTGGESLIGLLDLSGRTTPLVQSSDTALFSPSVPRDGKWMAIITRQAPNIHRVAAVPLRGRSAEPRPDWVWITGAGSWVDKPRWSPGGDWLYYISDRDGFVCVWAQRFHAAAGKLAGEPKVVQHFHSGRNFASVYGLELSVADDKVVFNLGEDSGNIWLAPPVR